MRIYIFSEPYYPDVTSSGYFLTEIAEHLALNNEVTVITVGKEKDSKTSIRNGVEIIRLRSKNFNKNNLLKRLFGFIKICLLFYNYALKLKINKENQVICVTNPALFIPFIANLKKKIGFKLTILVHDVFPENLVATKILSRFNPFYLSLINIFNYSYSKADEIIVCGRDMKLLFERKLKKYRVIIKFIPNWAETNLIHPISKDSPFLSKNKIVFQYAGNIGRAQGIPTLISALKSINSSNFYFHFYGKGPLLKSVIDLSFDNILYKGTFDRKDSNKFLNMCDVAIITLEKNMSGIGVPSKTYNILSAGIPILYIGNKNSEIGMLVRENNVGYVAEPGNIENIIKGLCWFINLSINDIKALKINSRELALKSYSKEKVLSQYSQLI